MIAKQQTHVGSVVLDPDHVLHASTWQYDYWFAPRQDRMFDAWKKEKGKTFATRLDSPIVLPSSGINPNEPIHLLNNNRIPCIALNADHVHAVLRSAVPIAETP